LRQQPWGAGITVVALTGQSQEVDKRSTREAGFDLHLVKPADPSTLRSLLAGARTMAA
jgi:CheY-like chemotaxis protein